MRKLVPLASVATAAALLSAEAQAQRDLAAGFSAQTSFIEVNSVTNEVGQLGTAYLPSTNEIFVTVRINPNVGGDHFVQIFDPTGAATRSWFQPPIAQNSEWGWRDGTDDGANLIFGYETGAQPVNPVDGGPVFEILTENNPNPGSGRPVAPIISGDVLEPQQAGVMRAMAYDPTGNGGDGSLWTGNFGSSTFEVDLDGNILTTYPNVGEESYGFGIDPATGNMWINSQPPTGGVLEYDLATGTLTGAQMEAPIGIAGGSDVVDASVFRGPNASGYDILHLQQATNDTLYGRRLHLDVPGSTAGSLSTNLRLGTDEPDLVQTIDDQQFFPLSDRATLNYTIDTLTFEFDLDISRDPGDGMGNGGLNGTAGVTFAQTSPDADINSSSFLLRELVHLQTNGITVDAASANPRSFPFVMTNDPSAVVPSLTVVNNPGAPFQDITDCVRLQSLYIDFAVDFLPLAMTNQTRFCRGPDPVILSGAYFETFGTNSFNSDLSTGFFSLTNETSDPITALTVSWINPSNTAQFDNFMRFDTDNPNMADIFLFGDSSTAGCQGTYRNNSAVDNGLDFTNFALVDQDFNANNIGTCPTVGVNTGYIPSDDGPTAFGAFAGDYLTLRFEFPTGDMVALGGTPAVFEWDADTDNGNGITGGDMDGMVVTIEFQSGTTSSAVHVSDPNIPIRGYTQL